MPAASDTFEHPARLPGRVPPSVPVQSMPFGPQTRLFLRWQWQRRGVLRRHRRRGETLPPTARSPGSGLESAEDSVTWVGHSTIILRLDGRTILVDPIWSRRAAHVVPRLTAPAPAWEAVPAVDFVAISHNHFDHMDAPTLRRLRHLATFLVPKGVAAWFRRRGYPRVVEFDWWQGIDHGGLRATFVPSKHFSGRTPWNVNKTLWGGWLFQGRRHSVWHAGCTAYFDGFAELGRRFPRLDLACVPIGAYEPRWFMEPVHVDPEQAGQAFLDSHAKRLLPIHWGTFRLSDEPMDEPPQRIRAFLERRGVDRDRLWLPPLGETNLLGD